MKLIVLSLILLCWPCLLQAADILFDVEARKQQLQQPEYAEIRAHCLAESLTIGELATPVARIKTTPHYGTENVSEPFNRQLMILGGRVLAGDAQAPDLLHKLLLNWEQADALTATDEAPDSYFELKRILLPIIINYSLIADGLPEENRTKIESWISGLVQKIDHRFGGEVDHNNHRQLTDSVRIAWGAFSKDDTLYERGKSGFEALLSQANPDGTLPLEMPRGARAGWYLRQTLSSLTAMAQIAEQQGDGLYEESVGGVSLSTLLHAFLNHHYAPISSFPEAAANIKPGPSADYLTPDTGYLHIRGHARHYLAFSEALLQPSTPLSTFAKKRFKALIFKSKIPQFRPLIDEFIGGNATCFFAEPSP